MYFARDTEIGNVTVRQENPKYTIHIMHAKIGPFNQRLNKKNCKTIGLESYERLIGST